MAEPPRDLEERNPTDLISMAPKKVWVNGKWAKPKWDDAWGNQKRGGKIVVDWACGNCDQQADPAYLGCYANQDNCPRCWTHKSLCQHMTMATRTERLKAGTLKPKVQAKADREARKNASNATGKGSTEESDEKFQAQLLKDYLAGNITKEELEKVATKLQNLSSS